MVLLDANFDHEVLVIDSKTELDIDYLQKMIQKTDSGTAVQVKALAVKIESGKEVILMSLDTSTRAGNLALASKISRCADRL